MAETRRKAAVFFGGASPEHDVSIVTGLQVLDAIDPERFEAFPVYIARDGAWFTGAALRDRRFYVPGPEALAAVRSVAPRLGAGLSPALTAAPSGRFGRPETIEFDVAVPALHGLSGENGALQGLFELMRAPYAGPRPLAGATLMDKVATKHILADTGIPLLPFRRIDRPARGLIFSEAELAAIVGEFPFPACVKPVNLGSSIGVARVTTLAELADVLPGLFRYDDAAILEPFVENLVEYNISVSRLGGESAALPATSAIEKPLRTEDLLDFKTKYLSGGGGKKTGDGGKLGGSKSPGQAPSEGMLSLTREINPALPGTLDADIRAWALTAFDRVGGTGAPRIDFLSNEETGEIWLNEVNPIPGSFAYFLWEAAAEPILFTDLLDRMIDEAFREHRKWRLGADPTPEDARLFPRRR